MKTAKETADRLIDEVLKTNWKTINYVLDPIGGDRQVARPATPADLELFEEAFLKESNRRAIGIEAFAKPIIKKAMADIKQCGGAINDPFRFETCRRGLLASGYKLELKDF